jgi:hypothetical protein
MTGTHRIPRRLSPGGAPPLPEALRPRACPSREGLSTSRGLTARALR